MDMLNGTTALVAGVIAVAYVLYKKGQPKSWTRELPGTSTDKEGATRRGANVDELKEDAHGCYTLYESFERAARLYGPKPCLGDRELIRVYTEKRVVDGEEKVWKSFEKGPYRFKTYAETFEWAKQFASGLLNLGLNPVGAPPPPVPLSPSLSLSRPSFHTNSRRH